MYSNLCNEKQSRQRYCREKESCQWDEVCDKNTYFPHCQKSCEMHWEELLMRKVILYLVSKHVANGGEHLMSTTVPRYDKVHPSLST